MPHYTRSYETYAALRIEAHGIGVPVREVPNATRPDLDLAANAICADYLHPRWNVVGLKSLGGINDLFQAAAEDFVAMRYVDQIQYQLRRLRFFILYGSSGFILAVIAIASYPFQPEHELMLVNTALFVALAAAAVWVFVAMDRDPLLSRLNNTVAGRVGWDSVRPAITFVLPPLVFALANQFPSLGHFLFSWVEPALQTIR